MAIGSDESAVLEVEVDVAGFERGMERIDSRARKTEQAMLESQRKQAAAAEAAAERREKAEDRAHKKALIAIGVSIAAWKKYFDFIATGTGATSRALADAGRNLDELKVKLATVAGEAPGVRLIADTLEAIARNANSSASAVQALGAALGMAVGPAVNLLGVLRDLASGPGGIQERGRALATERALALEQGDLSMRAEAGAQRVAGEQAARRLIQEADAAAATQMAQDVTRRNAEANRRILAQHERGGGGGGGENDDARQARMLAQYYDQLEERQRRQIEILTLLKQKREEQIRVEREAMEASLDAATQRTREMALEHNARLEAQADSIAEKNRFYAQEAIDLERQKQEAFMATVAAIDTVNEVLMRGGPAAQAVGRVLMAVQAVIYAQKAAGEVGEAIAAAARYDTWAAVGHAAAAVQFGVAAGMKLSGAIGGGGSASARAPSGGGGGGQFAPPRGSEGGREGNAPINVTLVLNAAGEVVDDSAIRRLGRSMGEAFRRGYVPGRRD